MAVVDEQDWTASSNGPSEMTGCDRLRTTFDWRVEQIEDFFTEGDARGFEQSVTALRDAARAAGADRIAAAASALLDADKLGTRDIPELLHRLRFEGRISGLEQTSRLREESLAAELSAFKPMIERDRD